MRPSVGGVGIGSGPKKGLLAKLSARKSLIQQSQLTQSTQSDDQTTGVTVPKEHTPTNQKTSSTPASTSSASTNKITDPARLRRVVQPETLQPVDQLESEEDESDSDSSSTSSSSDSSVASSPYVSSEDESDEHGRRPYRIFLCPIPVSCATAHPPSSAPLKELDPYLVPPPTPSPCHERIQTICGTALRTRLSEFGSVESVEILSKTGFPCSEEEKGVKKIAKGMQSCRECLACSLCREYQQHHYAYVNIRTTPEQVKALLQAFNRTKWRGEFVRVETAKSDFALRYKQERHVMKKKQRALLRKEEAKKAAAEELVRKQVDIPAGQCEYILKDQFGFKHLHREQIPIKEIDDSVKPLPASQLDWSEPEPKPLDELRPKPVIDYELLAAVFSGISSAPTTLLPKKPKKFRNEDDEWGALERGELEEPSTRSQDQGASSEDESMNDEAQESKQNDEASDDEWARLEQDDSQPPTKKQKQDTSSKSTPTLPPKPTLITEDESEDEDEDVGMDGENDAISDDELDAEFAALEQEQPRPQPQPPVVTPAKPKPVAAAARFKDPFQSPMFQPVKRKDTTTTTTSAVVAPLNEPSPKLAAQSTKPSTATISPHIKAVPSPKLTPAFAKPSPKLAPHSPATKQPAITKVSNWLGSDSENEDEDDGPFGSKDDQQEEEETLTLRAAFQGKKGAEMLALERSYGGDTRFKLDARFEEKDEEPTKRDSNENDAMEIDSETPTAVHSSTTASSNSKLPSSLSALSPAEFLKQHLLAEKRRALSILEEVAARPGYESLSLDEVAEDRSSTAGLQQVPEHSNIELGKSLKSQQTESRGRKRPDAHYTRTSFADTMEFLSDDVDPVALSAATSNSSNPGEHEADHLIRSAISVSLQKWMPILDENGMVDPSANVAQRVQIEAEDEEIERRKKKRYWQDVQRFDPTAEDEAAKIAAATAATEAAAAAKSAAKTAASSKTTPKSSKPDKLAAYTPQPKFNPQPDRQSSSARADGDKLYEIKTDRLRDLFNTTSSAPVSFSISSFSDSSAAKPAEPPKSVGIVPFKFSFGGNDEPEPEPEASESADSMKSTKKDAPKITFSAAPSKITPASNSPSLKPTVATSPPALKAVVGPSTAATSTSAAMESFHMPSWPEGHPSNPYKSTPTTLAATPAPVVTPAKPPPAALRASAFVKSLVGGGSATAKKTPAAAHVPTSARVLTSSAVVDSDSSDSDADDGGFMRSSRTDDETITTAWMSARQQATTDFKNKNKSAIRKSGGKKELVASASGEKGLKRSADDRALEVLEASEGKRRKK